MFWIGLLLLLVFAGLTAYGLYMSRVKYQVWGLPLAAVSGFVALVLLILVLGARLPMGYLLMVILGCVAGWAAFEARRGPNAWAKPLSGAAAVAAVLVALATLVHNGLGCADAGERRERRSAVRAFVSLRSYYLGHYLAENFSGKSALIVARDADGAEVDALRDALLGTVTVLDVIERQEDMGMLIPEGMEGAPGADLSGPPAFTFAQFDLLLARHPEADLLISLVGLPAGLGGGPEGEEFWQRPKADVPVLAVANADPLGLDQLRVRQGRLVILMGRPGKFYDPHRDNDFEVTDIEKAREYFVIIAAETLDEFSETYDREQNVFGRYSEAPADR